MSLVNNIDKYKLTASGLLVPKRMWPIGFDLFAGCGGFSLGFIMAGFEVVGAVEYNCEAAHSYMTNLCSYPVQIHYTSDQYQNKLRDYFEKRHSKPKKKNSLISSISGFIESDQLEFQETSGSGWIAAERIRGNYYHPVKNFFFGDIKDIPGKYILNALNLMPGDIDCLFGGPPCQGFSKMNTSRSRTEKCFDDRNNLVFEFARMVIELTPKTICMENVPEIMKMKTSKGIPVMDQFLKILHDGNYANYKATTDALNFINKTNQSSALFFSDLYRQTNYKHDVVTNQMSLFTDEDK